MAKTAKQLESYREQLLRRHPELAKASTLALAECFGSWSEVSAFIESCWVDSYAEEARILFIPEFLSFAFGSLSDQETGVAVMADAKPVCVVLGIGLQFENTQTAGAALGIVATGFSTLPQHRGHGYGQLAFVSQALRGIALGHDFALGWIDAAHDRPGSSQDTYGRPNARTEFACCVRIMGKALDVDALWGLGFLRRRERYATLLIAWLFPAQTRLPRTCTLTRLTMADADRCVAFIRDTGGGSLRRVFSAEEFARRYLFQQGRITGAAWLAHDSEGLCALAYGYTNPVREEAWYFALDGILFAPRLGYRMRRRILAAVEAACRDELQCCAVISATTASNYGWMPMGYAPIASHTISAHTFREGTGLDNSTLASLLLEIR